eukprot:6481626-Amphidinium_carterae.1
MERIRRRGASLAHLGPTDQLPQFSAERPWEWTFAQAVVEDQWWRRQIEDHVWAMRQKRSSFDADLGQVPENSNKRKKDRARPVSQDRLHEVSQDGTFKANRQGTLLCAEYQVGNCSQRPGRCPKNRKLVHQCNKCLQNHPGQGCTATPKQPGGKGKGKRSD